MLRITNRANRGEGGVGVGVARTRTVLQFTHGVQNARRIHFFMFIRAEIIGVTGGTIGLVLRCLKSDHLVIAGVAVITANAGAVRAISD